MKLHEYQAKDLLRANGVKVPPGIAATTVSEAVTAANTLGGDFWVVKAQVHAGGRGKGRFKEVESIDTLERVVRGEADVQARLDAGAARVVIGSVCVRDPQAVCDWIESFGAERLVAGLDVKRDAGGRWMPQAAGWTEPGGQDLFELLEHLTGAGLEHLLCTDIERDGMLSGAGVELYEELQERFPALKVQASGGIGSEGDIEAVAATGVHGCIVGRALLEGRVSMDAIGRFQDGRAAEVGR